MKVSWISAGISSFIASYLVKDSIDELIYIDIEDHHLCKECYLDELDAARGRNAEVIPACDIFCMMAV